MNFFISFDLLKYNNYAAIRKTTVGLKVIKQTKTLLNFHNVFHHVFGNVENLVDNLTACPTKSHFPNIFKSGIFRGILGMESVTPIVIQFPRLSVL